MEHLFLKEGIDFFKSIALTEEGNLQKAIPTVEGKKEESKPKKKMPKGFDKFKKDVEIAVKGIDEIVKELVEKGKSESVSEMFSNWGKFKSDFQWRLNDYIKGYDGLKSDEVEDKDRIQF